MKIAIKTIWENRSGQNISWFHPKAACMGSGKLLMTLQSIEGSDYYLPIHKSVSLDNGETWSAPVPVPNMGRVEIGHNITEGVCDVVPEYHAPTQTVLAIGHNVYYRDGHLFDSLGDWAKTPDPILQRYPLYAVADRDGRWTATRRKLEIPDLIDASSYVCGCNQRVWLGDDQLLIPFTFGLWGRRDRMGFTALCRYDGHKVTYQERGNILELPVGRGLMEPQLCRHQEMFYLTLRTEDGYGHYAVSRDGLNWGDMAPWRFNNGETPSMTNTQQHWLQLNGKLYLIYNRELPYNRHLMRWRAPLLIAEVDPARMVLIRETEQVVFPVMPEDTNAEFKSALFGNFHPVNLSSGEALILAGEERSHASYQSNTLLARLR
jgi:hypothetical protein